jgi:two-component system alkaline phosphatase synthesis response regulator PhoP
MRAVRRRRMTSESPLVLIVDDTAETRRLMRRVLERDRLRVVEAASGEDALRVIRTSRPQVVVLDLRLPGMSGFDVARELRANDDHGLARTPILACSASVQAEVRQEALDAGCDAFEGKPFDLATFAGRVREVIAQSERR